MNLKYIVYVSLSIIAFINCATIYVDKSFGGTEGKVFVLDNQIVGNETNPFKTIRNAILSSTNGDTIFVLPGTYEGNITFAGKNIKLRSQLGEKVTIVDCSNHFRAFSIDGMETSEALIEGFTIQNCKSDEGAGIRIENSSPTIKNCTLLNNNATVAGGGIFLANSTSQLINLTISNNHAQRGGGIFVYHSEVSFENSLVSSNKGDLNGGGVYLYSSPSNLSQIRIQNNTAAQGGGIFTFNSYASFEYIEILYNSATNGNGGGIYVYDSYEVPTQIVHSIISSNKANGNGGGWYMFAVATVISFCTLSDNFAAGSGGGLFLSTTSIDSPTIQNCTVVGNKADGNGGGIYLDTALFQGIQNSIYSSDFSENEAGGSGGGLYISGSQKTVVADSSIEDNSADNNGGGIYVYDSSPKFSNSIFSNNTVTNIGGGLYLSVVTSYLNGPDLTNLTISNNKCGNSGCGLFLSSASSSAAKMKQSRLTHNAYLSTDFEVDGAASFIKSDTEIQINSSVFFHNLATRNGGAFYFTTPLLSFFDSFIQNNSANGNGGGGVINSVSSLISKVLISGNSAGKDGGGIYQIPPRTFSLTANKTQYEYLTITSNSAGRRGGGIYWSGLKFVVYNCSFTKNTALEGGGAEVAGTLLGVDKDVEITNSDFTENIAYNEGGGILVEDVGVSSVLYLNVEKTQISQNNISTSDSESSLEGGGIKISTINANFKQCKIEKNFINGLGSSSGGGIQAMDSVVTFINSSISENILNLAKIQTGAGVGLQLSTANFLFSSINENKIQDNLGVSDVYGGGIHAFGSKVYVNSSTISENEIQGGVGAGISVISQSFISILGSYIYQNIGSSIHKTSDGGGIFSDSGSELNVSSTTLESNTVDGNGGAIYSARTTGSLNGCVITKNNAGKRGGGISLQGSKFIVSNSFIQQNRATSGAAGYLDGTSNILLQQSNIINNNSTFFGGIMALPPAILVKDNSTTVSNNSPVFYEPHHITLIYFPSFVIPSRVLDPPPIFEVQDFYNNTVIADRQTILSISSPNENVIEVNGQKEVKAVAGIASFTSTMIYGPVPSLSNYLNHSILITSTIVNGNSLVINFMFSNCPMGYEPDARGTTCLGCQQGFYNFDGKTCLSCPTGGICGGGSSLLTTEEGYWRSSNLSDNLYACSFRSCLGNDVCSERMTGPLCAKCIEGFFFSSSRCIACQSPVMFYILIVVVLTLVGIYLIATHGATSWEFSCFMYFAQNAMILHGDRGYFQVISTLNVFSFDFGTICAFRTETGVFIFWIVLPVLSTIILLLLNIIRKQIAHRFKVKLFSKNKKFIKAALVALFLIIYTPVSSPILTFFSCVQVEDKYYMTSSLNRQCYDKTWWKLFPLALIGLVLYAVALPVGFFVLWWRSVRAKTEEEVKISYLFYATNLYKPNLSFWTGIILQQRVAILLISSFLTRQTLIRGSLSVFVTFAFWVVHMKFHPFKSRNANYMFSLTLGIHSVLSFLTLLESFSTSNAIDILTMVIICFGGAVWALFFLKGAKKVATKFIQKIRGKAAKKAEMVQVTPHNPEKVEEGEKVQKVEKVEEIEDEENESPK